MGFFFYYLVRWESLGIMVAEVKELWVRLIHQTLGQLPQGSRQTGKEGITHGLGKQGWRMRRRCVEYDYTSHVP